MPFNPEVMKKPPEGVFLVFLGGLGPNGQGDRMSDPSMKCLVQIPAPLSPNIGLSTKTVIQIK